MESRIKDNHYFQVSGWMVTQLNLKGWALMVYAIIYGFSQDGQSEFRGSVSYLCDWCGGVTRPTITKVLKELVEQGLLTKRDIPGESASGIAYKAVVPLFAAKAEPEGCKKSAEKGCKTADTPVKNLNTPCKNPLHPLVKNLDTPCKDFLHNNNSNTNIHKDSNTNGGNEKKLPFDRLIKDYSNGNPTTYHLLSEWLKVRKASRKPMTTESIQLNLESLKASARSSELSINDYLTEVIKRGWHAFYIIDRFAKPTYDHQGQELYTTDALGRPMEPGTYQDRWKGIASGTTF